MDNLGIPGVCIVSTGCKENSVEFAVKVTSPFRFLWWGIHQQYDVPWWAEPYVFFIVLYSAIQMQLSPENAGDK